MERLRRVYPPSLTAEPEFIASPLYHAARLGLVDVVTALLKETNRINVSLHQPMHQRSTSETFGDELRIACFYDHEEVVKILLNAGADVKAVGGAFETAMGACMHSAWPNPNIIQMILERFDEVHPNVNWISGWAFRWAAIEGHLPVVRTLISRTNRMGPGNYAWTQKYLLNHGWPDESLPSRGRKDIPGSESYPRCGTAPYEAAFGGHYEILSLLISDWSDIDEEDAEGRTSLYWAAFNGHTEIVKLLLENGAQTHGHRYLQEWTPAYWARMKGFREIEDLLLHTDRSTTQGTRREPNPQNSANRRRRICIRFGLMSPDTFETLP